MSDNNILGSDLMSGLMRKLDKQIAGLKTQMSEVENMLVSTSGLEQAVLAIVHDSPTMELAQVPGVILKLSKERSLGAALTSEDGEILMANPAFYRLTAISADADNDQGVKLFVQAEGQDNDDNLQQSAVRPWDRSENENSKKSGMKSSRYAVKLDNNQVRWLQFVVKPLLSDGSQKWGGCLSFVAEATEEVSGERQIAALMKDLQEKLDALSQPMGDFNSVLSRVYAFHDFGPVQSVLPEDLNSGEFEDGEEMFFRDIEDGIDSMITSPGAPARYVDMISPPVHLRHDELDPVPSSKEDVELSLIHI